MSRPSLLIRGLVATAATGVAMLVSTGAASAIVVDVNPATQGATGAVGPTTFPADQANYYGVAMTQFPLNATGATGTTGSVNPDISTDTELLPHGIPTVVTSGAACSDPWLSSDLVLPSNGLCWHAGGSVMHGNETFALTWDPDRRYFATTKNYVETYLQNVASASGSLGSPYALTGQYADGTADAKDSTNLTGRAENASVYGGACVDFGSPGGYTCQFGNTTGTGAGNNYPNNGAGSCGSVLSGINQWNEGQGGLFYDVPNDACVTDGDIRGEINALATQFQGYEKTGYTPTVVVLTPPGVEVCLDQSGSLCSANGQPLHQTATGLAVDKGPYFCSYHAVENGIPYVVVPWVASWDTQLGCDDPGLSSIGSTPDLTQLATDAGQRLVSPLEQSQLSAIVNPDLNGWFSNTGLEMNDNDGCTALPALDTGQINGTSYQLQRMFNNAGLIETDPNALACTGNVLLTAQFVAPSTVNVNDLVEFDGSTTVSTLIVPRAGYAWSFGDGTTATGPSVSHTFAKPGTYTVTLTVTDRGGNTSTLTRTVTVLGSGTSTTPTSTLRARIQLQPSNLRTILRDGIPVVVSSTEPADGVTTISITRRTARKAHIHGKGNSIVVGRGTVSGLVAGTNIVRLHINRRMARKLKRLHGATLTVRVVLLAADRNSVAVDAAGQY